MDTYKLLSRSTRLSRRSDRTSSCARPASDSASRRKLQGDHSIDVQVGSKKRKRGQDESDVNLLSQPELLSFSRSGDTHASVSVQTDPGKPESLLANGYTGSPKNSESGIDSTSVDQHRAAFNAHKVKATWLNPPEILSADRQKARSSVKVKKKAHTLLFPKPMQEFRSLESYCNISPRLLSNVHAQGFKTTTEVQRGALPLLMRNAAYYLPESANHAYKRIDLLTIAPTGSGKTLAYMIPLLHSILGRRAKHTDNTRNTAALVLAPTKELAGQIVNEGRKLARGIGVKVSLAKKGMILSGRSSLEIEEDEAAAADEPAKNSSVKADLLVCTPGLLQSMMEEHHVTMPEVQDLVLDEADVLLDPLFREQTLTVWGKLTNVELRVSMWSATMGSNIEELARTLIRQRRLSMRMEHGIDVAEVPLIRLVVGLKDSAVPNVRHKLIYAATEQGKLMGLRQLLRPVSSSTDLGSSVKLPLLVFTQTIERAVALHSELLYDIPAEAGGSSRVAVLHSDLSDTTREGVMMRFRNGEVWVLITTDLLSRGVDFRGVKGVVSYDIPTSSAAYVHRIGRTGRAGAQGCVAVTLYSKEDIPYLKHVANIVAISQSGELQDKEMQAWLADALPKLSKNAKHDLKTQGVKSRKSGGQQEDPRSTSKTRISTKAGFVRRSENKRRGVIAGSKRRARLETARDAADDSDFGGFD